MDVGQRRDPTAIAVAELSQRERSIIPHKDQRRTPTGLTLPESTFIIRSLGRLPLGTSYPMVVHRVSEVLIRLRAMDPYNQPELVVDATGVGMPIYDELAGALNDLARVVPATFVAGGRFERDGHGIRLGKAYLVSRLQALVQAERIRLPETDQARALAKELTDYEIRVDESAKMTAGAFKVGTHDDLATALGLAVLQDKTPGRFFIVENDPDEVAALDNAIGVDCSLNILDETVTGF
ncbi:MAG: hypothetical protein H0W55_06335 [Actinobacteria bacterium]|nr:hypothetical protein [Actinomycetota bacterium]MDQ3532231.1 hypothetical protein [Actinomycetota bacterium]